MIEVKKTIQLCFLVYVYSVYSCNKPNDVEIYYEDDLKILNEIIELNALTEASSDKDNDNGDGIFEPLELGLQYWENNRLVYLDLSTYPIGEKSFYLEYNITTIPQSIGYLDSLWSLDLSFNQLTILPESIGNLSKLRWLRLTLNELTFLPSSISNLDNLKHLYLDHNKFYCVADTQDTSIIPDFLTDGSIENVVGLYDQDCSLGQH